MSNLNSQEYLTFEELKSLYNKRPKKVERLTFDEFILARNNAKSRGSLSSSVKITMTARGVLTGSFDSDELHSIAETFKEDDDNKS